MKKLLLMTGVLVLTGLSIIELNAFNNVTLFLVIGLVPGTDYSIPASIMLLCMITFMWLILINIAFDRILPTAPFTVSEELNSPAPSTDEPNSKPGLQLRPYRSV